MFIDPSTFASSIEGLNRLEEIEKASHRLVTQALVQFVDARELFNSELDQQKDIGEDLTREALERRGVSGPRLRVAGTLVYRRARLRFHPDYAVRQALLVDSKAEKGAENVARLQTSQTSMRIKQVRAGLPVDEAGGLPTVISRDGQPYLTTTIFVKYIYEKAGSANNLRRVCVICLPNGMLQTRYNPDATRSIWNAGPNAPSRGEAFRTRINFPRLKALAAWRVQNIHLDPAEAFVWNE
jgi:hypothetical protein